MNINNIVNLISKADPETFEKVSPRRDILKSFTSKVAVAALPFVAGSLFKKAYGKTTEIYYEILSYALTLEYFQSAFFQSALANQAIFPNSKALNAFKKIADDQKAHVTFFENLLNSTGSPLPPIPAVDFTGGNGQGNGPFQDAFMNYSRMLALAQSFKDMSVRAYKGQLPNLIGHNDFLMHFMRIHSVEARHAAQIRMLRKEAGAPDVRPWITGNDTSINDVYFKKFYAGEENTTHENINVQGINGNAISLEEASQAFDEPLAMDKVQALLDKFIAG